MKVKPISCVRLFVTPWTIAHQIPPSMGFKCKNTGVDCHFLLQEIFPTQGLNPGLLHCRQIFAIWATRALWKQTLKIYSNKITIRIKRRAAEVTKLLCHKIHVFLQPRSENPLRLTGDKDHRKKYLHLNVNISKMHYLIGSWDFVYTLSRDWFLAARQRPWVSMLS